jgi:DNA-directed RNA polymerase subunit N (RpoN/RPB10)
MQETLKPLLDVESREARVVLCVCHHLSPVLIEDREAMLQHLHIATYCVRRMYLSQTEGACTFLKRRDF